MYLQALSNLLIYLPYLSVNEVQLSQLTLQQKAVMGSQGPRPRLDQRLSFLFHPSASQVGSLLRVLLPFQHGLQNRPSRLAGAIAGDGGQFAMGVFQRLLDATLQPCAISCQTTAGARQVPQFPLGTRRHKARSQQAMLEQVGFQYTPVDSMATAWHCLAVSHSRSR